MLQKWFGPSREAIWRQLSEEIGAQYVDGGIWKGDKVQATHGEWVVTLDTYVISTGKATVVLTRMRAPYVNPHGFKFTVYRKSIFSGLAKWLGMQDIEIGDPPFDDDFIIKSNDESRVRELLAKPRIKELIAGQKDIQFTVKDDEGYFGPHFPDDVDELHFQVLGVIKDVDRLKLLYELFAETLDELCRIGSAREDAPDVKV
jgi:hypothetical protein